MLINEAKRKLEKACPFIFQGNDFYRKRYNCLLNKTEYAVYKAPYFGNRVVAAWNDVICVQKRGDNHSLILYPSFKNKFIHYKVNIRKFKGIIKGSAIQNCFIIPFIRVVKFGQFEYSWRLVITTDRCQVFHNFPAKSQEYDGAISYGDITKFEESLIWDLPGNKFPSKNADCDETEYYNPCLPDSAYKYYPSEKDSKFPKTFVINSTGQKLSRFYIPIRDRETNPFAYMGGFEPDYKMTVIGTYRSNMTIGVRTVIFATTDGGKNWFAKFEFADDGETKQYDGSNRKNVGNVLDGTKMSSICVGDIKLCRRLLIHDSDSDVYYNIDKELNINQIHNSKPIVIETKEKHQLETGNIVFIKGAPRQSEWEWAVNNDVSVNSNGNGMFFKTVVLDDTHIELYENVSNPNHNISCRHIHHINRTKDVWIIGTGEVYPNGWLLYMQMLATETYTNVNAWDVFPIVCLNNGKNSVQRTLGAVLVDDSDNSLFIASDSDELQRPIFYKKNDVELRHNSLGIYKGSLDNINNFESYESVLETLEPAYFFKQIDNVFIYSGQRGELAFGFDAGSRWEKSRLDKHMIQYRGRTYDWIVIDDYLIVLK